MNQIRYGQLAKYGEERGDVGNKLGDVPFSKFGEMIGGYGEEVTEASQIQPALQRAREAIAKTGRCAVVNVWVDPMNTHQAPKRRRCTSKQPVVCLRVPFRIDQEGK